MGSDYEVKEIEEKKSNKKSKKNIKNEIQSHKRKIMILSIIAIVISILMLSIYLILDFYFISAIIIWSFLTCYNDLYISNCYTFCV